MHEFGRARVKTQLQGCQGPTWLATCLSIIPRVPWNEYLYRQDDARCPFSSLVWKLSGLGEEVIEEWIMIGQVSGALRGGEWIMIGRAL